MQSIWIDLAGRQPGFPALDQRLEVDTVIVGGGITGLSTALRLSEAGQRVAVLESKRFGALNTGGATGNLYSTASSGLQEIRRKWNEEVLRDFVGWRAGAVDWIEAKSTRLGIECEFARRPLVRGVAGSHAKKLDNLNEDFSAAEAAGLAPRWIDHTARLPFELARAFRIENQAQFNPYKFAVGVARVLAERGVALFENSHVTDIDAGDGRVMTDAGEVRAENIVLATHSPTGVNLVQMEMEPYRELGVSALIESGPSPEGIFWIEDEEVSIRSCRHDGREYLVVVGGKHRVGHAEDGKDFYEELRDYARSKFAVTQFVHAWGAQQFVSADGLPYIGRSGHKNVLIATGFAADGLAWGAFAAEVIEDIVHGRKTQAVERLTPRRFAPVKSARVWWSENKHTVSHLVKDWFGDADLERLDQLAPGSGAIIELGGSKRAIARDGQGRYSVVSPICTHLGCEVHWNGTEQSWDCPCHGSRFATDGTVIDGPASKPLEMFIADAGLAEVRRKDGDASS